MSQAPNPRDNQALLQSMLQRLKLQPGAINIQSGQNTSGGHNTPQESSDLQTINNNNKPINGFEPTGNIKRDFTINGKGQEIDSSSVGSRAPGHMEEHGQSLLLQTGQLFSSNSVQDTSTVSSSGGYNFSKFEIKKDTSRGLDNEDNTKQTEDQYSSYVPKVYAWSPKNPDIQDNKVSFEEVFGVKEQNTQTVSYSQKTKNNRKQRSSENKTQRWTQKIKEKWRERPSSFGKKGKDNSSVVKTTQENSPQYLPVTAGIFNSPSKEESETSTYVDKTDHNKTASQTSDGNDEYVRSQNDFDLGLGSFSLLDEIVSGQEWAVFLNPSISASAHDKTSAAMTDQTLTNHLNRENSGINLMSQDAGNNSWTLGTNGNVPGTDITMTVVSPEPSFSVGMDRVEKSHIQSEPMDQGLSQTDPHITVCEQQPRQPTTNSQLNTLERSSLTGRNSLSRKRQYQSPGRIQTMFQSVNGNDATDDGSVFLPDNHTMNNTSEGTMFPVFSSTPTLCSPVRGVLKSTISCDSTNSETVSKRRRMEDTRRVRFSEEIISIDPPELGPWDTDSEEEEEEEEEDSLIEEDSEEQVAEPALYGPISPEQVAPARRPVLPGWIRALKRRNTGKKPR